MIRRWVLWMAAVAVAASSGCASGDGVAQARIANKFSNVCIAEANFLGYAFSTPIGVNGASATREVYDGTDRAYAVTQTPLAGGDCAGTASMPGGTLWATKATFTSAAGTIADISFSETNAVEVPVDCNEAVFMEGRRRFTRLDSWCK